MDLRAELAGGLDEPVVLVTVADGEAQVRREGVARCRTCAARGRGARSPSAVAAARSGEPKSTSRKFVTLGPTDQPAAVSAVGQAAALALDTLEVASRAIAGSRSASVTIVAETVDTDPGGRYGFDPGDDRPRGATAKPTRSPASA